MTGLRIKCACKTSTESVQVALVQGNPCELWLTHFGTNVTAEVGPMELFGFNLGSFRDKPAGPVFSELGLYLIPTNSPIFILLILFFLNNIQQS